MDMIPRCVAVSLSLWIGLCTTVQAADHDLMPSGSILGKVYPSACAPGPKRTLRDAMAKGRPLDEEAAWQLIDTALCAPADAPALAYLDAHVPAAIEQIDPAIDTQTKKVLKKDRKLLMSIASAGAAWDASLYVRREAMSLQYYGKGRCIQTLTFQYVKGNWMLKEINSACG